MKIALFGAGGEIARRIARKALSRGQELRGVVRSAADYRSDNERVQIVEGDATDAASVARVRGRVRVGALHRRSLRPRARMTVAY